MADDSSILTAVMEIMPTLNKAEAEKIAKSIDEVAKMATSEAIFKELSRYQDMTSKNNSIMSKISKTIMGGGKNTIKALKGLASAAGEAAEGMNQGAELIGGAIDMLQKPGEMYKEGGEAADDMLDKAEGIGAAGGDFMSMVSTLSSFGVSQKDSISALERMAGNIADLSSEGFQLSTGQTATFDEDLKNATLQNQIETIMASASKMNKADRTAFLKSVFGRKGGQVIETAMAGGGKEGEVLSGRQKALGLDTADKWQALIDNAEAAKRAPAIQNAIKEQAILKQNIAMMKAGEDIRGSELQQQVNLNKVLLKPGTSDIVLTGYKAVEMAQKEGTVAMVNAIGKLEGTLKQVMADGKVTTKEVGTIIKDNAQKQMAVAGEAVKTKATDAWNNMVPGFLEIKK